MWAVSAKDDPLWVSSRSEVLINRLASCARVPDPVKKRARADYDARRSSSRGSQSPSPAVSEYSTDAGLSTPFHACFVLVLIED